MAEPRVLSVGQCGFDHGTLSRYLARRFGAETVRADTAPKALVQLRSGAFNLVLVNRVGDADGAPGLDLIRTLKSDPATAGLPVMLVSNYPEAQAEAVALGALPGFGKGDLRSEAAEQKLGPVLGHSDRPAP